VFRSRLAVVRSCTINVEKNGGFMVSTEKIKKYDGFYEVCRLFVTS